MNGAIFAAGLSQPETPVVLSDGSWLVVEMGSDRGCVTHISADGSSKRAVARTGRPNGLAVDGDGIIWVAETHPRPSLVRVDLDGGQEVVMEGCDGEPFLLPNDLCFGPDGTLYMTDSGIRLRDWAPHGRVREDWERAETDGKVFRIDLAAGSATTLDSGLGFANGICFGPGGDLYANEMLSGEVYRYPCDEDGRFGGRERVANVVDAVTTADFRGPDGMAFDAEGRLYVTVYGQGDLKVIERDGSAIGSIPTAGKLPTNVAFGSPGDTNIYVTEVEFGRIEVFDVGTEGARIYP